MSFTLSSIVSIALGFLTVYYTSPNINFLAGYKDLSILTYHGLFVDSTFALLIAFFILCYFEHRWIAKNQSFPYSYHPSWNVRPRAFDFQLVIFEVFHISKLSRIVHAVNLICEEFLWLAITYGTFGVTGLLLINILTAAQAILYRDFWLAGTIVSVNSVFSLGVTTIFHFAHGSETLNAAKIALFWIVVLRTASHVFEPVPPVFHEDVHAFDSGFGDVGYLLLVNDPLLALWLFVLGTVSELGAGIPGRLFNVVVYKAMHRCGYASKRLLSVVEAKEQARMVTEDGWSANETTRAMYEWALQVDEKGVRDTPTPLLEV